MAAGPAPRFATRPPRRKRSFIESCANFIETMQTAASKRGELICFVCCSLMRPSDPTQLSRRPDRLYRQTRPFGSRGLEASFCIAQQIVLYCSLPPEIEICLMRLYHCKQCGTTNRVPHLRLRQQPVCGFCGSEIDDFPFCRQVRKAWRRRRVIIFAACLMGLMIGVAMIPVQDKFDSPSSEEKSDPNDPRNNLH